jgi:hypothetical protein
MLNLPLYISIFFILTTFLTLYLFYLASNRSQRVMQVMLAWLVLQGIISYTGFYTNTGTLPPRFILLPLPALLGILLMFVTRSGRAFIDSLDHSRLVLVHIIRIPVEITLFLLFVHKTVPEIMTFTGRNPDILSGISAALVYYFGFIKTKLNKNLLVAWNIICTGLLLNIVLLAIFSAPFIFQQLAFDQPNVAVFYFPYSWLPCFIVPIVLLSHLASLRKLANSKASPDEGRPAGN